MLKKAEEALRAAVGLPSLASLAKAQRAADAKARGAAERSALAERLRREGADDLAQKLDNCGVPLRLVCTCCGNRKSVEMQCRRRWCPACAWVVQRERLEKYQAAANQMQWPLFITLTMPNRPDAECIREIRGHWSKLRRRKLIVDRIKGGLNTIEITNKGNGWHPHLHVLADCQWLALHTPPPQFRDSAAVKRQKYDHARLELSALWCQIIKSPVGVVSALRKPPGECIAYALKYAVKGSDLIESPDPIADLIRVLSRSRMLSTFGALHGLVAADDEEERPAVACSECGNEKSFMPEDFVGNFRRGDDQSGHGRTVKPSQQY